MNIDSLTAIEKLSDLKQYTDKRFVFADGVAIGHFAVAALSIINSNDAIKSYNEIYNNFDTYHKGKTQKAVTILMDLTKQK